MIDYKISWSPGTNALGWPGTPLPTPDPLHRGYTAHRQRDWRTAQAAYIEALRARPNRALAAYNFGLLQINQGMGLSSIPFLLRASLLEPESATYQGAMLYARLRSEDLDAGEALLADCEDRGLAIDTDRWCALLLKARAGVTAAALDLPTPLPLDPLAVREPPDLPLTLLKESPCHAGLAGLFNRFQELYLANRLPELLEELAPVLNQHADWGKATICAGGPGPPWGAGSQPPTPCAGQVAFCLAVRISGTTLAMPSMPWKILGRPVALTSIPWP